MIIDIIGIHTFIMIHVVLSLIGILSGFIVVLGMLSNKLLEGWTALFLASTVLTSMTSLYFRVPFFSTTIAVAIITLIVLAVAILALYGYRLAGPWRWSFVMGAVLALYLNVFLAVAQLFKKVQFLRSMAPTLSEPPFYAAQLVVMIIFIVLGARALRAFHPEIDLS